MIKGLYKTDVVTITPEKSLREVCTLMRDRCVGDVIVVDRQAPEGDKAGGLHPIGIVTDRDIVTSCLAEGKTDLDNVRVSDAMSKKLAFVKADSGLFDTIRRMREAGVGRILVVDENEMLLGILTATSIFELLNEELHELGLIARSRRGARGESSRTNAETVATIKSENFHH